MLATALLTHESTDSSITFTSLTDEESVWPDASLLEEDEEEKLSSTTVARVFFSPSPTGDEPLPADASLASMALYYRETASLPKLTDEQWEALIDEARAGVSEAREALLLGCLRYIQWKAHRLVLYSQALHGGPGYDEQLFLDLCQEASCAQVARLDEALSYPQVSEVRRSLFGAARGAMLTYLHRKQHLLLDPQTERPAPYLSLDAPSATGHKNATAWIEVHAHTLTSPEEANSASSNEAAKTAQLLLERSTVVHRRVLLLRFGLDEEESGEHSYQEIADMLGMTRKQAHTAMECALLAARRLHLRDQQAQAPVAPVEICHHFYTLQQALARLGVSRPTLYSWVYEGRIVQYDLPAIHGKAYARDEVEQVALERAYACEHFYTESEAIAVLGLPRGTFLSRVRRGTIRRHVVHADPKRCYAKEEIDARARLAKNKHA